MEIEKVQQVILGIYNQIYTLSKRRSYVLIYDKENGLELQYTNHVNHAN